MWTDLEHLDLPRLLLAALQQPHCHWRVALSAAEPQPALVRLWPCRSCCFREQLQIRCERMRADVRCSDRKQSKSLYIPPRPALAKFMQLCSVLAWLWERGCLHGSFQCRDLARRALGRSNQTCIQQETTQSYIHSSPGCEFDATPSSTFCSSVQGYLNVRVQWPRLGHGTPTMILQT